MCARTCVCMCVGGGGVHLRVCGSGKGGDIESDNALSN